MTLTDFITEPKSLLIAPAGHGKTYAIASCIKLCPIGETQLVLTHTHAGISSISSLILRKNFKNSRLKIINMKSLLFLALLKRLFMLSSDWKN